MVLSRCPSSLEFCPYLGFMFFCLFVYFNKTGNSFLKYKLAPPQDARRWERGTVSFRVWSWKQNPLQKFQAGRDFMQDSVSSMQRWASGFGGTGPLCTVPKPRLEWVEKNLDLEIISQIFSEDDLILVCAGLQCLNYYSRLSGWF